METLSNQELRKFITAHFNDSELEMFCFDYFQEVRNNFTVGMNKNDKVMSLIDHCRNRQLIQNLQINLRKERQEVYEQTFNPQESFSPAKAKSRNAAERSISEVKKMGQNEQPNNAQQRMVQTLQNKTQPTLVRVRAGNELSRLGDIRFRSDAWYLPNEPLLGFVEVPAGKFKMGLTVENESYKKMKQHTQDLPLYYIAKYPVTTAQFRSFVESSEHIPKDKNSLLGPDNHPVVDVSWHDARAYCNWLTRQLRDWAGTPKHLQELLSAETEHTWRVFLPSEAEWEKAARGINGQTYPWSGLFDIDKANVKETGLGETSAVGCFPGGESPYGCLDMVGNVWEWTRSIRADYPYQPSVECDEIEERRQRNFSVRGDSAYNESAHGGSRDGYYPYVTSHELGWRVVISDYDGRKC